MHQESRQADGTMNELALNRVRYLRCAMDRVAGYDQERHL